MRSPTEDIAGVLSDELGYELGTDLFVDVVPSSPDSCVTLVDMPGAGRDLTLNGRQGVKYQRPSIQIRVRDNNYRKAYSIMEDIEDSLHGRQGEVRNGAKYTVMEASSSIARLGRDENNRAEISLHFSLQRTPA